MNICDNCKGSNSVESLTIKAVIKNVRRLIVVNYSCAVPSDDSFRLCRACLVQVITQAEETKRGKIGFNTRPQ